MASITIIQKIILHTPGVLSVVFGVQGDFVLANSVYTLAYLLPGCPLAGVPSRSREGYEHYDIENQNITIPLRWGPKWRKAVSPSIWPALNVQQPPKARPPTGGSRSVVMKTGVKPAKSKQFNRYGKDFGCGEVDLSSNQTAFASGISRLVLYRGLLFRPFYPPVSRSLAKGTGTLVEPFPSHSRYDMPTRLGEKGGHAPRSLVMMG
ncbi:hypothetical protein PCH_Pc12g14720 [Penicillium rubens Wisconsin 54-1255]|uniref:Uncharacterized protein n=1 Tax=Penicillium rubens (strain ATCC 28089 / DSM 1075 / NRRL 1951 / Wisconsin 54-1255) TaxID=500485 RepID=B6GWW1_PENRW|nr:hypothetical protein PCH_Pc12g14720 [Penicillium rubens Wisconsin 54-1255]